MKLVSRKEMNEDHSGETGRYSVCRTPGSQSRGFDEIPDYLKEDLEYYADSCDIACV